MPVDDHQLIAKFQAGEYRAFDTLYQRYARRVLGFAYQLTGDMAEAEDLTQETFIGAFRGMHAFRGRSQVLTWLLSIAIRRRRDTQRAKYPQTVPFPVETDATWAGGDPRYTWSPDDRMEAISLRRAMKRLPAPLREVFLLVVVQELTYREAAHILDCPLGSVKRRVAQALREVRAHMLEKEEDHVSTVLR